MIGIDQDIAIITDAYNNYLWPDSNYFGRVYPNERKDGVVPEVYTQGIDYREVLLNDKVACTSFFYVLPNRSEPLDIWIHFAVDLTKIYPTLDRDSATEKAILQAKNITETSGYSVIDTVTGVDSYETWTFVNQNRMDMQKYFLFRLELQMWQTELCETSERTTYNLNLSTEGGGITEPYEGSEAKDINSTQAINAVPNDGFDFVRWLINGVEDLNRLTTVTMTKTINAIAEFIGYFTLNISSDGNGTTTPTTGSYETEFNTYQEIEGIPDEGNKFDNFDIDGDIITDNPYQLLMNGAKNVIAFFSSLVEVFYQTIFTGADDEIEELLSGGYGYKNYGTGGEPVRAPILNTKVAKFGDDDGAAFSDYTWDVGEMISFTVNLYATISTEYIITNDKISGLTDGIRYNGFTFLIKIGSFDNDLAYTSKDELVEISVVRTTITDYVFYENGIIIGTIVMPTTNTPLFNLLGKRVGGFNFTGIMACMYIEGYLKYSFQEGSGDKIWDSSGNGNHAVLSDTAPIDFWDYTSDMADPVILKEGYTLFLKDGTTDEYLRVIYANGQLQSSSEVGYTYQYEIPPNAGFSNTGNTVNWAVDAATQAIADKYAIPYTLNYTQMAAIDFSVINEDDLNVIHENNVFTQWNVIKE